MYDDLGDFLKEHWDYLINCMSERKLKMTEPIIENETEVVDMDELSNQEIDLDEHPIDLTKDNKITEIPKTQKVIE